MFSYLILFCLLATSSLSQEECQITLPNGGTVTGSRMETVNPDKSVCAYTSIPYASSPTGNLRFQPPQPAQAFTTLNATSPPNWCPQATTAPPGVQMSEDCLYLNVFQPANQTSNETSLPVMIWFHGGGFTGGSSTEYTPIKLLARGDIILVVVHYRLGLLGFFSTGDEEIPGNNGMKDQAFSIRWVNENIAAFRGNPNQVTIFGESAGGASTMLQLISPLNKGLIQRAISQSGNALSFWVVDKDPKTSAKVMARRLLCPDSPQSEMVACVTKLPWVSFILAQGIFALQNYENMTYAYAGVTPVVEPNLPGAFLPEDPEVIMRTGDIENIPVLIGANKHDASFILAGMHSIRFGPKQLDKDPEYMKNQIVPEMMRFVGVKEHDGNRGVASTVELTYLNGVNRASWNESMPGLVDILTSFGYKSSVQSTAEILSSRNSSVYIYSMEHHSKNTIIGANSTAPVEHGVAHGDELMYLFDFPATFSPEDQLFADIICDLWINFAKTGNPTPTPDERFGNWPAYNFIDEPYLKLNTTPTVINGYRNSWRPNGFEWN